MNMTRSISSVLRYPGGKSKKSVQQKILRYFPDFFKEYREPFVGGGGIFYAIDPAVISKRWINDINKDLICFYNALRDRPVDFIAKCREVEPEKDGEPLVKPRESSTKSKGYNARLKQVFDEVSYNEECDQAFRYFYINRTVWGGRVTYDPAMKSRMYFSNPGGWNIVATDKLEKAADWIRGTKITCGDYSALLEEDGDDVVVYCDPPYVVNTELEKRSQLYAFGFDDKQHKKFADAVKNSRHKVIISYDDCDEVRDLFREADGFFIYEEEWTYCGTASPNSDAKKKGKELVITNFSKTLVQAGISDVFDE